MAEAARPTSRMASKDLLSHQSSTAFTLSNLKIKKTTPFIRLKAPNTVKTQGSLHCEAANRKKAANKKQNMGAILILFSCLQKFIYRLKLSGLNKKTIPKII